jgi:hypothetical protein
MINKPGILITGYNRPELLKKQIDFCLSTGLSVFVAIDGPKEIGNLENKNRICREMASNYEDELDGILINEKNLGCNISVTNAITWAFEHVESLIILEDDIGVDSNFINFALAGLKYFEQMNFVSGISGMNLVPTNYISNSTSIARLTCFTSSWGWATWKDRWTQHLLECQEFPNWQWDYPTKFWTSNKKVVWKEFFSQTSEGGYDTWDFRWQYSNLKLHKLSIVPNINLALNFGFGEFATHTTCVGESNWLPKEIFPVKNLNFDEVELVRDAKADKWMATNHYGATGITRIKIQLGNKFPVVKRIYRLVVGKK